MKCPKCQYENRETAKFCLKCGERFKIICFKCGLELPLHAEFCDECGQRLEEALGKEKSPEDTEGERRQVTVLFSDLSGYTAMSERLDPEEVKEIMSRIFGEIAQVVAKYEGFIEKFIGDAVVAFFGVPKAHEDDPLRAIKAAKEIHGIAKRVSPRFEEKIGRPLSMHTGINTGLVVTGEVDVAKGTHGVVGDTLNLASRLADLAKPGEILVSSDTQKLILPYFKVETLGLVTVKGKAQQITAYRVQNELAEESRFEVAAKRGLTPFTGREQELAALRTRLEKTVAGNGQFLSVAGEAGVGKSRLLYEFQQSLDRNKITIMRGRCQSIRTDTPYFPFISALAREFHLREGDKSSENPEGVIANILAIDQRLEAYLPFFLGLLSIPNENYPLPDHLAREELELAFQDALAAIYRFYSELRPIVLILEDWQWADEASDAALKHLVGVICSQPIMVVTLYRPDYSPNWGNMSHHTSLVLKHLETEQSQNIIKCVLGAENIPTGVLEPIIAQTGGNPLFIEEVCRSLMEDGVIEGHKADQTILTQVLENRTIPDTIQAIISTRLDRLDSDAKEVLRLASVVGRWFGHGVLKRLYTGRASLKQVLENLKALGMIQQTEVFPEAEYRFSHTLTQEVAYGGLLLQRRRVLHELVGQAIEHHYPDRIDELVNLLQHHFALGENWPKAIQYGRRSAEKAAALSQFSRAATILEQVQRWLLKLPEDKLRLDTQIDILLQQERLHETFGLRDQQQAIINQLFSLVLGAGDQSRLAEAHMRQGDLYTQLGQYGEAERALHDALRIWRDLSDKVGESRSLRSMGFLLWNQGLHEEAIKCNEQALEIDRQLNDLTAIATDLNNLGALWRNLGNHERALACLEETLEIHETTQNPLKKAFALYSIANIHREQGALDFSVAEYHRAHDIFAQHHDLLMSSRALTGIAGVYREQGKLHESLRLYEDVLKISREINFRQGLSHALYAVSDVVMALGQPDKSLELLQESANVFAEMRCRESEVEVWEKIADIYENSLLDDLDALAAWEKARDLHVNLNDHASALRVLENMGQLVRHRFNDPGKALKYFLEALSVSERINDLRKQADLLNTIGIIEWNNKMYEEALEHYKKAFDIYIDLQDDVHAGLILNSIGLTLGKLRRYSEALARLREAMKIHHRTREKLLEGHCLAIIGDINREIGEKGEALRHYQESLEIRREIGDRRGQGWMLYSLGLTYAGQDVYEPAKDCLLQARVIAQDCADAELSQACANLFNQLPEQQG
jgi:predicted ATPase/class 3 adenylate cyclase